MAIRLTHPGTKQVASLSTKGITTAAGLGAKLDEAITATTKAFKCTPADLEVFVAWKPVTRTVEAGGLVFRTKGEKPTTAKKTKAPK